MAADIAFVHSGRQRNGKKKRERKSKPWHVELTDVAPEIPLIKGQHPFHLKIEQRNCLPKYTEIKSHQCGTPVNPQNTVFHQTFIVKCHLSSVKTKVVLLSDRRVTSWNYPAKLQSRTSLEWSIVLLRCYFFLLILYTYRLKFS